MPTLARILGFVIIGCCAGWLAGKLTQGRGFGVLGNLVVGVVGAVVGGMLFQVIGLQSTGPFGSLVTATAGAIVLLFALSKVKRS